MMAWVFPGPRSGSSTAFRTDTTVPDVRGKGRSAVRGKGNNVSAYRDVGLSAVKEFGSDFVQALGETWDWLTQVGVMTRLTLPNRNTTVQTGRGSTKGRSHASSGW